MPINRDDNEPVKHPEKCLRLRNPDELYSNDEICDLLEKAESMGFSLEKGSDFEDLTIRELDILVNVRQ